MAAQAVMERYAGAVRRGDWQAAYGSFSPDVVGHVPGRSALAGELRGREAVIAYIEAARAKSRGADVHVEIVGTLASEERVMLLVRERFARGEAVVEIERANVYVVRHGAIVEAWIFEGDQYAVDALLDGA
jgi:ketosteroid isomerase-like protein